MRLEQLKTVVAVARNGWSVSRAAEALGVPQPALSRQLRSLERDLRVEIFIRQQKRLKGLTRPGALILEVANRILSDVENLAKIGQDFSHEDSGSLIVATTHTQARYVLPNVVQRFVRRYPGVRLMLRQGNPSEVNQLVASGAADIAIGSDSADEAAGLRLFECYPMDRVILTPARHPLLKLKKLSLDDLAGFPLITYDAPFVGRSKIVKAFAAKGLAPQIVLSSIDTDVIKAYVELGLGIAIVAKLAYDPGRDRRLRAIDASHLFEPNMIYLGVRNNDYLRRYVLDFIEMYAPHFDRSAVAAATGFGQSA